MISIIRLQAQENRDKTWDNFLENLNPLKKSIEGKGRLLYLSQRARHQDVSLFVHAADPNVLGDFIAKNLAQIKDLTSIWTIHLMKPLFFPIPKDTKDMIRFTITAKLFPSQLKEVYENLVRQSAHDHFPLAYIAFTFHLFEESVIFSLLTRNLDELERYVRETINKMPGILGTNSYLISRTKPLISYEEWKSYALEHSIIPNWDVNHMIESFQA